MHVAIIGAGLSGLTSAYLIQQAGIDVTVVEARPRLGGRIWTQRLANDTPVEAGATWFGMKHQHLVCLLDELDLAYFPQATEGISLFETMSFAPPQRFHIPKDEPASYRIAGGSSTLIQALAERLNPEDLRLNTPVSALTFSESGCTVHVAGHQRLEADAVVVTLPPRLFAHAIKTTPTLPLSWKTIAQDTHTWMGESIKFFVAYRTKFWAEASYSGTVFSQSGIITEMYDHSNDDDTKHALKGFLAARAYQMTPEQRKAAVFEKLTSYFGPVAADALTYGDVCWQDDAYTRTPELPDLFPHQNNGHPLLREPLFDGKLFVASSETADAFPGYMDGAINAAHRVVKLLKH